METTGKKTQKGGATLHPWPKDTDPVYSGGWTILAGPNLNHEALQRLEKPKDDAKSGRAGDIVGGRMNRPRH